MIDDGSILLMNNTWQLSLNLYHNKPSQARVRVNDCFNGACAKYMRSWEKKICEKNEKSQIW